VVNKSKVVANDAVTLLRSRFTVKAIVIVVMVVVVSNERLTLHFFSKFESSAH
jgi:hypothetical protein